RCRRRSSPHAPCPTGARPGRGPSASSSSRAWRLRGVEGIRGWGPPCDPPSGRVRLLAQTFFEIREREAQVLLVALAERKQREHAAQETATVEPQDAGDARPVAVRLEMVFGVRVAP